MQKVVVLYMDIAEEILKVMERWLVSPFYFGVYTKDVQLFFVTSKEIYTKKYYDFLK